MSQKEVKIVECPRDAMQGVHEFIPTQKKIAYLSQLLKVGFDTLDFGSFVSPKAIPQLKDTVEVLNGLDLSSTKTKLLAIIANERGATEAVQHGVIDYLGYPFSISETFQKRNTNATIDQSLSRVEAIQNLAVKNQKELVIYISMGFGNPYGDPYHEDIVATWIEKLHQFEINTFALSDTIGVSEPTIINRLFSTLLPEYPDVEIGAHLHTTPTSWREKIEAAYQSGCRRFDGALKGFGGCPMAADDLTGNMATENIIDYFQESSLALGLEKKEFQEAMNMVNSVFSI